VEAVGSTLLTTRNMQQCLFAPAETGTVAFRRPLVISPSLFHWFAGTGHAANLPRSAFAVSMSYRMERHLRRDAHQAHRVSEAIVKPPLFKWCVLYCRDWILSVAKLIA